MNFSGVWGCLVTKACACLLLSSPEPFKNFFLPAARSLLRELWPVILELVPELSVFVFGGGAEVRSGIWRHVEQV